MAFNMNLSTHLKEALLKEYGSFADKRIKSLDKGSQFMVDDRAPNDFDSRGHLYNWFCMIFAEVQLDGSLEIVLTGSVPDGESVREWIAKNRDLVVNESFGKRLTFKVAQGQHVRIQTLATAI